MPLTADSFTTPPWYAKSARETKAKYREEKVDESLGAGYDEAKRLGGVIEGRGQQKEDTLRQATKDANVPTWTDADFQREFSRGADDASGDFMSSISNLRSMLGASGMTGSSGWAQGLAADMGGMYHKSLIQSRSSALDKLAMSRANDRLKQYDRMSALADVEGRDPSMVESDFLQMLTGVRLQQQVSEQNRSAAKDAANAAKDAGTMGFVGDLFKAAIPLVA